jgi:hypothetical protein
MSISPTISPKVLRRSAALALAVALAAAPAAQAAGLPSPLARAWQRLIHLVAREGLGLDPNGTRRLTSSAPAHETSVSGAVRAVAPGLGR